MFSEHERNYFEQLLDAKFENLHNKIDTVIDLQKQTNGRVNELEVKVESLEIYKAKYETGWKIWGKVATITGGVIGGVMGYIANKIWP